MNIPLYYIRYIFYLLCASAASLAAFNLLYPNSDYPSLEEVYEAHEPISQQLKAKGKQRSLAYAEMIEKLDSAMGGQ